MKSKSIAAIAAAMIAGGAFGASDFADTAQVISATPIIERVSESRQECGPAPAPQKNSNITGPIIGGVLGGLLGHQIGQGGGQTAATIVGATGGAVAGTMVGSRATSPAEQNCRNIESSREVVHGYNVAYRYNGHDVNVKLPYDPGSTIAVSVGVILEDRSADSSSGRHGDARRARSPDATAEGVDDSGPYLQHSSSR